MCFGPSSAEKAAAASQREAAEDAKQEEIVERAENKREDISDALSARTVGKGKRGGVGRRSLFSSGSSGFLGRFS
mgnify:FL=1|tara:strand:+ start:347 stop:571 length:225 start_codon:yes stop_codon:yes gene_type:complete